MARHGENIRKRNDGRWEGRYKVFDEGKGKHIYRSVYGRDYGEAKEKLSRARLGLARQGMEKEPAAGAESGSRKDADGNGGGILFSQAAGEWLAEVSRRRKYSTFIKYNAIYRAYLADTVGLCRLSLGVAQELNRLSGAGLSESMLSPSTQKSIVCVANQILAFANRHYQTGIPPLERKATTTKKKPATTFSRAEQAALLGCLYDRMEKELEEIFAANPDPLSIPDYDNLKPVMFELNSILAETDNYTLTFGTVDTSESIIRRGISMSFTCGSYDSAKGVLEKLHDSSYRCMLDNLNVSLGSYSRNNFWDEDYYGNSVVVSGNIVFFGYQAAQGD